MADIELVIKINEDIAQGIIDGENDEPRNIVRGFQATIADAIKNGTPLPKGHWIDGVCSECGWDAGQEAFSEDANFCMKCGVKMLPIGAEKE